MATMNTGDFILKKYGPLLTVNEVAELLRRAPGTIENEIARGRLQLMPEGERKRGKRAMFHYKKVASLIDAGLD